MSPTLRREAGCLCLPPRTPAHCPSRALLPEVPLQEGGENSAFVSVCWGSGQLAPGLALDVRLLIQKASSAFRTTMTGMADNQTSWLENQLNLSCDVKPPHSSVTLLLKQQSVIPSCLNSCTASLKLQLVGLRREWT